MPLKHRKIAIIGFRSVGKTSPTTQFVENQFNDSLIRPSKIEYQLELIDSAGQDELSIVSGSHLMNVDGYILVYAVITERSFEVVRNIRSRLQDLTVKKELPVVLVGNKTDLRSSRVISMEVGRKLAEQWKAMFVESSA